VAAVRQHWRDAVEVHTEAAHWAASDLGTSYFRHKFQHDVDEYRAYPDIVHMVQMMYTAARHNVAQAVPFFISTEMGMLIEHATYNSEPPFEPEPLFPTDVLELEGFMYFEKPFQIHDRFGRPFEIAAVSWTAFFDPEDTKKLERILTRDDEVREWLQTRHEQGRNDGLAVTLWSPTSGTEEHEIWETTGFRPRIVPTHVTPWMWGMEFGENDVTIDGRPTGAEHWWKLVQITWRLMQQHIVVRHREQIPRPLRRERSRYGIPPNDCVVVTLRRERNPEHGDGPSGEEAHYSHRFFRRGHWRNQWYPSEKVHRQIYIARTIVGDESLPLIIKPHAYTWTR